MMDTYPKLHFQLVIFAKLFITLIQAYGHDNISIWMLKICDDS